MSSEKKQNFLILGGYLTFFIIIILVVFLNSYKDEDALKVLRANNYTQVELTGYKFFDCSSGDTSKVGFKAIAPNGEKVNGVVCQGIFKSSTIRLSY